MLWALGDQTPTNAELDFVQYTEIAAMILQNRNSNYFSRAFFLSVNFLSIILQTRYDSTNTAELLLLLMSSCPDVTQSK